MVYFKCNASYISLFQLHKVVRISDVASQCFKPTLTYAMQSQLCWHLFVTPTTSLYSNVSETHIPLVRSVPQLWEVSFSSSLALLPKAATIHANWSWCWGLGGRGGASANLSSSCPGDVCQTDWNLNIKDSRSHG